MIQPPASRMYHGSCVFGHTLLFYGGINDSGILNDFAAYDLIKRSWTKLTVTFSSQEKETELRNTRIKNRDNPYARTSSKRKDKTQEPEQEEEEEEEKEAFEEIKPRFLFTMTSAMLPQIELEERHSRRMWVTDYNIGLGDFPVEKQGVYIFGGQMLPDSSGETGMKKMLTEKSGCTNEFSNELWFLQPDFEKMSKVLH